MGKYRVKLISADRAITIERLIYASSRAAAVQAAREVADQQLDRAGRLSQWCVAEVRSEDRT